MALTTAISAIGWGVVTVNAAASPLIDNYYQQSAVAPFIAPACSSRADSSRRKLRRDSPKTKRVCTPDFDALTSQ